MCARCCSHQFLVWQVQSVPVATEVHDLIAKVNELVQTSTSEGDSGKFQLKSLQAKRMALEQEKSRVLEQTIQVKQLIDSSKTKIKDLQTILQAQKPIVPSLSVDLERNSKAQISGFSDIITSKQSRSVPQEEAIDQSTLQRCRDLTSLFTIRRRKLRANSSIKEGLKSPRPQSPVVFETSIAFTILPDLRVLSRHPHTMINASVERLAYFCFYIANYLNLSLPYTILPPQKQAPFVRISGFSHPRKQPIVLLKSVKTTLQETPRKFDMYAEALAMLALDLSYIAAFLKCTPPMALPVEAVVQVDQAVLAIQDSLLTTNLASSPLWQYQRPQLSSSPRMKDDLDIAFLPDLEDVTDFIITRNFVEINGGSAEWNLVDKGDDMN